MKRILVSGASGFIGGALARALVGRGLEVRAACRRARSEIPAGVEPLIVGAFSAATDWTRALEGVSSVVHCAGPARVAGAAQSRDAIGAAASLARQAAAAGVERFVYLSSAKAVAGRAEAALSEADAPSPDDAYGKAKLAAERAVMAHAAARFVVLRAPLVHGAASKGNFARLLRLADTAFPLPLADLENRRSVIALAHLIAAIEAVLSARDGPAGVFHVADRPALATGEIITALREGLGRPPNLVSAGAARALLPRSLRESLELDDRQFRSAYGYGDCGGVAAREALAKSARAWKAQRR